MKRNKCILWLLTAALLLSLTGCAQTPAPVQTEPVPVAQPDPVSDNYRTFYQIFVGSFSDASNDGIGDLRGILNRLDYLNDGDIHSGKSLGVQGIWLSPIFSSPSYHKYDTTDYYEIDWRFGTQEDLKALIEACHQRNVKVILDLVINHTSSRHPWFEQFKIARATGDTEDPYYDYYSCVTTAEKQGGIQYQKIAGADCWYECNFSGDMPELNFDNPAVRQEMLDVARFYLDMGVDGFRFDAVKYIYFGDAQRNVEFWQWYMEQLQQINPEIYCVGECWSGETEILEYCSAMNCFNFAMAQAEGVAATAARGKNLASFLNYVVSYQDKLSAVRPDAMAMSFLSNHDMDRIGGAFALENHMRMAANLYLLSPGSPMIYYGEEIGLRGSRGSESTDANRRLAMPWGDDDLIRDPIGATYPEKNRIPTTVAQQTADGSSLYSHYCRLIALRHSRPAIARGTYSILPGSERTFGGFRIDYQGQTIGLLHNTGTEAVQLDLSTLEGCSFRSICGFAGMDSASLEGTVLTLGPQTSVIVE